MVTLPDDDFAMRRSRQLNVLIGAEYSAPQHEHAPRPLPLFLQLVRDVAVHDPELARNALKGLSLYSAADRDGLADQGHPVAHAGAATLRDQGGCGRPVVFVPSLINPPHILNLDDEVSLTKAVARTGHRALLVDWGNAEERNRLSIGDHVEQLLLPLLDSLDERAILIGYCLGGTMAIAAAAHRHVAAVVTLAAPWRFSRYPEARRAALQQLWQNALPTSRALGVLPVEVLQASFWSLDPERTVKKFADLIALNPSGPEFRRFVALEDWANEGDPLPLPAATELMDTLFTNDATGRGQWQVGSRRVTGALTCPALHFTAARDRITPAETAPEGARVEISAGHVGMVVGRARHDLQQQLAAFLASCR
jgi:polyhydroxyalkanoate synthase